MKLIIDISQKDYDACKKSQNIGVGECLLDNIYNAVKYGKPYEEGMTFDYVHGYVDALNEDGKYKAKPQGEWEESHIISCGNILRMGENVIEHKCKNCGKWSIKWERTIPDNFCSNCGVEMKGGEDE